MEYDLHDPSTAITENNSILKGKIALAHFKEFPGYSMRLLKCFGEVNKCYASDVKLNFI
jgi:hypothetical protein